MKQVRQKLNSSGGVSIILALLFLLVCAAVSAVVITAAGANADRTAARAQEQQAYLAVRSAVDYFRSELDGAAYTGNQPETRYQCYQAGAGESVSGHIGGGPCGYPALVFGSYAEENTPASQPHKALWELATLVTQAHLKHNAVAYNAAALTKSLVISAEGMPDVLVNLTMLDDAAHRYDVILSFDAVGADCTMSFSLGCAGRPQTDDAGYLIPDETPLDGEPFASGYHSVTWSDWGEGGYQYVTREESTTAQKYKNLYSVRWASGRVIKGGAS